MKILLDINGGTRACDLPPTTWGANNSLIAAFLTLIEWQIFKFRICSYYIAPYRCSRID